jgi:hypothetical protein
MTTQNQAAHLLSDIELDAVVGGVKNCETPQFTAFYDGLYGALNQEGRNMLQDAFSKAQRAAGE